MSPHIQLQQANRHQLLFRISLCIFAPLLLAGCATSNGLESSNIAAQPETVREEINQLRSDIGHLRSYIYPYAAQLKERIDTLERRASTGPTEIALSKESVPPDAYQELKQATEVLLKNALETERRISSLESTRTAGERSEPQSRQVIRPATEIGGTSQHTRREMKHGMTQEDIRTLFGNPTSTAGYSFGTVWHYPGAKSVTFNTAGRVTSWYGF
jgi:outer membrane murein-binding lipoprotein Lpp